VVAERAGQGRRAGRVLRVRLQPAEQGRDGLPGRRLRGRLVDPELGGQLGEGDVGEDLVGGAHSRIVVPCK
jgi:hypothetical protein